MLNTEYMNKTARQTLLRTGLWAVCSLASLWMTQSAHAFKCSSRADNHAEDSDVAFSWFTRQIPYVLNSSTLPASIDFSQVLISTQASFAAWQDIALEPGQEGLGQCGSTLGTTDIVFAYQGTTTSALVGFNTSDLNSNQNVVILRYNNWIYGPGLNGVATVTADGTSGQILDADIEIDAMSKPLNISGVPPAGSTDFRNTLTHEIGHLLGLAHPSIFDGTFVTNNATMAASAVGNEIIKRDLTCDDARALVFKYPSQQPLGYCPDNAINPTCGNCVSPEPGFTAEDAPSSFSVPSANKSSGGCRQAGGPVWSWLLGTCAVLSARQNLKKNRQAAC